MGATPAKLAFAPFLAVTLFVLGCVAAAAEPLKPGRVIRYTGGAVTVSGWEAGLVEGNPNLAKFFWAPMTSYRQSYRHVPLAAGKAENSQTPRQAFSTGRPAGQVYVKPVHVPLPAKKRQPIKATGDVRGSLYKKPIQLPLPANQSVADSLTCRDVYAKLEQADSEPAAAPRSTSTETVARLYPGNYQGQASPSQDRGQEAISTAEVRGRLLR